MTHYNGNDETLVMLTLAGDQSAYEILVRRYERSVIAAANYVTHSSFMAEDAAQDAFVTAWMKLNTLREPDKYGAWVCRIAKNCAKNMITRYRGFLSLNVLENLDVSDGGRENPAELYVLSEEKEQLHKSIGALPEKIKQVIHLHYFEGLPIAEISEKMRVPEGTVKWQLHDGRKRIRKELCAMNEKWNDTLVERVMKKVEELKLWQVKNNKSGFEREYKEVLREVEDLPESSKKHHALADVLMRGWWWLPGDKNDALFERIRKSAELGKNDEVMEFIVTREDSRVYEGAKIEFMRDKQIPRLEKAGFVKTLAREWFWLGYNYFKKGRVEEGQAAYDKVEELLSRGDLYHALVPYARKIEEKLSTDYKEKSPKRYLMGASAEEYRYIDGSLRYWATEGFGKGEMISFDRDVLYVFRTSASCDGRFFADIPVGESFVGSDGTTLTYASDNETVDTPAGKFEGCQLWVTKHRESIGAHTYKSYYKDGVGIVRHEHTLDGLTDCRVLKSYNIKGGKGLLPIAEGNTWEYDSEYDHETLVCEHSFTVSFADDKKVILSSWQAVERLKYDENSWLDMIQQIRNEYWIKRNYINDVSSAIERAEALAKTPMEKAHTKAAASVARRIMATDPTFNPNCTATGHWNFFSKNAVCKKKDSLSLSGHYRWSFEWKSTGSMGAAEDPILYNDILGILRDATNCIWSDEWRVGASPIVEYTEWDRTVKTFITCENGGTVTTKAGTFENCLKLCMDIGGMTGGLSYRGGKKNYYFAEGVGIVRTENEYCGGARTAVYELTSYEGIGEGYMPMADGLVRRYDALDLTDGFVGASEYYYVADDEGNIVIFSDRTGIRDLPPPITQYGAIQGEMIEDQLMNAGNWKEAHIQHGVNNVNLILHYLARPSRNYMNAKRSIAIMNFNKKLMASLGDDGAVPEAWCGVYAWCSLVQAAAFVGNHQKEEAYACLEDALTFYERWHSFEKGKELTVGNEYIFGGAWYIKDEGLFIYSDGRREPVINYDYRIEPGAGQIYYALTAPKGWEWFNGIRNEERFKEYIERAKALKEKYYK